MLSVRPAGGAAGRRLRNVREAGRKLAEGAVRVDGTVVGEGELPAAELEGALIQIGRRRWVRVERHPPG